MIIAATGHRPTRLGGYGQPVREVLGVLALKYLAALKSAEPGGIEVLTGMALGWDQAVAVAALRLRLPLIAAVPFAGQELRWPDEAQARYQRILANASRIEIITPLPEPRPRGSDLVQFLALALEKRNHWLVDHADQMLALWDGGRCSGTGRCLAYAKRQGRPFDNLWPVFAEQRRGGRH